MIILLDNGHGKDTAGKHSPDGRLLEYAYTREITKRMEQTLKSQGYDVRRIVPEDNDISLQERCIRVNNICNQSTPDNVLLVSVHCNAAGSDGKWHNARGWEAWTCVGQTKSDYLATCLYEAAGECGFKLRKDESDGDPDKEGHLYILKHTKCAAVLTENLFQDNKEDVDFLLSENGMHIISKVNVDGIIKYIKRHKV